MADVALMEGFWTDITKEFRESVQDLDLGEMISDPNFGLLEAISAIELMNPSMDSGIRSVQRVKEPKPPMKFEGFEPFEIVEIMDHTMALFLAYLDGQSVLQTVLTDLYMHEGPMAQLQEPCLHAFNVAVLKLVVLVRDCLGMTVCYHEEDFQMFSVSDLTQKGLPLDGNLPEGKVVSLLRDAEKRAKQRRKKSSGGSDGTAAEEETSSSHSEQDWEGVVQRLQVTRLLFQGLLGSKGTDKPTLKEARGKLNSALDVVKNIASDMHAQFGEEVREEKESAQASCPPWVDPFVNQHLLPPTFPRVTVIPGRVETWDRLVELVKSLHKALGVIDCNGFDDSLDFLADFSASKPCVLSRAFVVSAFIVCAMKVSALEEATKKFLNCSKLSTTNSEQKAAFFEQANHVFAEVVHGFSFNRARLREKLPIIFEEMAQLQESAEKLDRVIQASNGSGSSGQDKSSSCNAGTVTTWVLHHTLQLMALYVLLGFELNLYCPREYRNIFWYLEEFLYKWTVSCLITRSEGVEAAMKGNRKRDKHKPRPFARNIQYQQALQCLTEGYFKTVVACEEEGRLEHSGGELGSDQLRYERRFAPFSVFSTPPVVRYGQFIAMTTVPPHITAQALYTDASNQFSATKKLIEGLLSPSAASQQTVPSVSRREEELNTLLKVAKTNFVVAKLLANGYKKGVPPSFDFDAHPFFPIMRL